MELSLGVIPNEVRDLHCSVFTVSWTENPKTPYRIVYGPPVSKSVFRLPTKNVDFVRCILVPVGN